MTAIDTAAKRAKLRSRKNPYWLGVSGGRGGLSLGYRKPTYGAGAWVAKLTANGNRREGKIGIADDEPIALGALNFRDAIATVLQWGRQQYASIEIERSNSVTKAPTVKTAVDEYIAAGKIGGRLKRYVLSDELASVQLSRLTELKISEWRERLPAKLAAASKNRVVTDLRAALNASALRYRRILPAHIPTEIKVGTKAEADTALPRHQLLTDGQVHNSIKAAFEVDPSDDFGRLVILLAATGARFSQIVRVKVRDVQAQNARIMVPGSHKGRNRKVRPPIAVPVAPEVIEYLRPILRDRAPDEHLLSHWVNRRLPGSRNWIRDQRRPWSAAYETLDLWAATVKHAALSSGTVMYALRHSSIVRMLLKNVPVRVVAAQHDTSIEMIERHYAAYITDMSEGLARTALMTIDAPAVAVGGLKQVEAISESRKSRYASKQLSGTNNGRQIKAHPKRKAARPSAEVSVRRSA